MKSKEFKKILKKYEDDYNMIVRLYCMDKIYLYPFQLNKVLKLRGEKKYPHYILKNKKYGIEF